MAKEVWSNYSLSALAQAITGADTVLTLKPGDGIMFPSLTPGAFFRLTLFSAGVFEVVIVQARGGDVLSNVLRGQEGTQARAWPENTTLCNSVTAGAVARLAKKPSGYSPWGF